MASEGRESTVMLRLLGYLKPYRRQVTIGLTAAAVVTLASLLPPYLAGYLIDRVVRPIGGHAIFLDAAAAATDARLWSMALTAMAYALVRFVEAVGLWRQRVWAEWFGILSGSIYLPVEIYELTVSVRPVKLVILAVNLFIVGWLSWVRWQQRGRNR